MANAWTKEQRQVIDLRGCDMLVSAAAGSGKTAVLVERIISRIMEEREPVDIDRLLVVTFTNAAAAEMRERIREALERKLEEEPENVHLQRQITLVHHAQITTIHSFCLEVIRSQFHTIGIDPGFRVGDEGELKLLRHDVMERLLEEAYQEKDEAFLEFSEAFAVGRSDQELEALILQIYDFSMGYPWPGRWREQCLQDACPETMEAFLSTRWMEALMQRLERQLASLEEQLRLALSIAEEPYGPWMYAEALEEDIRRIGELKKCRDYRELSKAFRAQEAFTALSRKRDPSVSEQKKTQVKELRDQVKKSLKAIAEDYFFALPEEMLEDMRKNQASLRVLLSLTEKFQEAFERKKSERCLVDFNDLEHFALRILVRETPDGYAPSPAAEEYARQFQEIMIDEYQDSNLVQEILLTSVSKKAQGGHNLFMVGDVKQSIYRFRLARPELFMEKYHAYTRGEGNCRRIDLHRNFRSRPEVLDGVNLVFRQIMTEAVGGVEYDEEAELCPGAEFAPGSREAFRKNEVILIRPQEETEAVGSVEEGAADGTRKETAGDGAQMEAAAGGTRKETAGDRAQMKGAADGTQKEIVGDGAQKKAMGTPGPEDANPGAEAADEEIEAEELDARRREAFAAAERIREIVGREVVWDKQDGCYRPARYGDIVILLRTVSGWADTFAQALGEAGIPAHTGGSTGYFSALEVRTVLAYLQILDNPRQDIPLAAVLRSPIGGFTDEELARLRVGSPGTDFYTCCMRYLETVDVPRTGSDASGTARKLRRFFAQFQRLRGMVNDTPMHLLLWRILEETGYGDYAAAMPGGAQRAANLEMLAEKAVAYEATSYRGLFNFVRYIENLRKYEIDYGEASVGGESEDTVRILSIHKSKGLEFPIVFVCGLGKTFNRQDSRSRLALHPELGIGCDYVDPVLRVKQPLLIKKAIARQIEEETLGEELRVLYVAMTRAKEKLILTGTVKKMEERMRRWSREGGRASRQLSYSCLTEAGTYLDWVMPALLRAACGRDLLRLYELPEPMRSAVSELDGSFTIRSVTRVQQRQRQERETGRVLEIQQRLRAQAEGCDSGKMAETELTRVLRLRYPYEESRRIPGKMTVSELKRMGADDGTETGALLYEEPVVVPLIPRFRKPEEAPGGAARGTVYHRFLEKLDFTGDFSRKFAESQLEMMVKCGKILKDEAAWISMEKIARFLDTELAARMQQAARAGKLFREQPFVLGVPADTIRPEWDGRETVLLQGIIDAWFFEGETLVLVDYKTDFVREGRLLAERYGVQLDCYRAALERLTGKPVKEKVIYSFCLNETIWLK